MADFSLTCTNQRNQRYRFLLHESGNNNSRFNVVSPYSYDLSGILLHTVNDFNMRRKAEILKYKNSSTNNSNTQKLAYLSRNRSALRLCSNAITPKLTTASDVPGKPMMLYSDPDIPLYRYTTAPTNTFQNIPYDNFKRIYDVFPKYNIISYNALSNEVSDIVILNPDNDFFSFGCNVPISVKYKSMYDSSITTNRIVNSMISIRSAKLDIYYSDSIITSKFATYNNIIGGVLSEQDLVISTYPISINMNASTSGEINLTQFIGNIFIPQSVVQTVREYVYTFILTVQLNYFEYTDDGKIFRRNDDGGNISNSDATSITNVNYSMIINVDEPTAALNSNSNCKLTLYKSNKDPTISPTPITSEQIIYIPFSIVSNPI
jgi:hypothetical protein